MGLTVRVGRIPSNLLWVPKTRNHLKYLTFVPAMIILQRGHFPNLFIARDKGSDHAIYRLHPARIHWNMVSLTCVHAD
jgi:hypothetical protein